MARKLAGDSATPLYQQVANDLHEAIVNDVYHVGARVPTETELSRLYDVSRITIRKAIEMLVEEGLLAKRQGKGTFVQESHRALMVLDDRRTALNGFSASCRQNGLEPGSTLLRREVVDVPPAAREFFGENAQLIAIDRVCTADETPIMIDHCLFAREGHEFLETAELENASLFDLIRNATGQCPHRDSAQMLSIQLADEQAAHTLSVPVGEPLFSLEGLYRDQDGNPLYAGKQLIIASRYTFSM